MGFATALLLHEGLLTDALYRVDDALALFPGDEHLQQMLVDYETRAGLRR